MAAITIRDLDEQQMTRLRARAEYNGRSLEDEARALFIYANHNEEFRVSSRLPEFTKAEEDVLDESRSIDKATEKATSQSPELTWETVTDDQLQELIENALMLGSARAYHRYLREMLGPTDARLDLPEHDMSIRYVDFTHDGWPRVTESGDREK